MKKNYLVTGMTCSGCVNRVKTTLATFAESVDVTLDPPQAVLTAQTANIGALNAALNTAGHYTLHELENLPPVPTKVTVISAENTSWFSTYKPLLLVFGYILFVCLTIEYMNGKFDLHRFMPNFMAGFFLVFSFFKLLDLRGFASSYAMYDVLAKKWHAYGFIYPFIELGLGAAYLLAYKPMLVNIVTLLVMALSSIGVIMAVANKQKIKCACLGTGFNLPMTTVTIIENLLMAGMAAWMLL